MKLLRSFEECVGKTVRTVREPEGIHGYLLFEFTDETTIVLYSPPDYEGNEGDIVVTHDRDLRPYELEALGLMGIENAWGNTKGLP